MNQVATLLREPSGRKLKSTEAVNRLQAGVRADAFRAVLHAEAGVFPTAERRGQVVAEEVHTHRAGLDARGDVGTVVSIRGKDGAAQAER